MCDKIKRQKVHLHATVTLLYQTLQSGNSAHMGDACRQKRCIQNCDQTTTDGYYWRTIESRHRPFQRYHLRPPTTYRSATISHEWHSRVRNDTSRSFEVDSFRVIWKSLCNLLLVINSNFGFVSHRFWDTATYAYLLKMHIFPASPLFNLNMYFARGELWHKWHGLNNRVISFLVRFTI